MKRQERTTRISRFVMPARPWALLAPLFALAVAACDSSIEPRAVMEVRISPDSAHLAPGESMVFEPRPRNASGVEMPHRRGDVEWSVNPPSLAEIVAVDENGTARVTVSSIGLVDLIATVSRRGSSIPIHVHPPGLDRIEIDPSPVLAIEGAWTNARAVLLDAEGEELGVSGFRISWQTADTTIARLGPGGGGSQPETSVRGLRSGRETILRLIVNGRVVTVPVIVTPPGAGSPPESTHADPER